MGQPVCLPFFSPTVQALETGMHQADLSSDLSGDHRAVGKATAGAWRRVARLGGERVRAVTVQFGGLTLTGWDSCRAGRAQGPEPAETLGSPSESQSVRLLRSYPRCS